MYVFYCLDFKADGAREEHLKQNLIVGKFSYNIKFCLWYCLYGSFQYKPLYDFMIGKKNPSKIN